MDIAKKKDIFRSKVLSIDVMVRLVVQLLNATASAIVCTVCGAFYIVINGIAWPEH